MKRALLFFAAIPLILAFVGYQTAESHSTSNSSNNRQFSGGEQGENSGGGRSGQKGEKRKPPQEAIEACTSQSDGASCSFESPHGMITGTCKAIVDTIACVPEHGKRGKGALFK